MIEVLLENYLNILVFGLKVTTHDGHDVLISPLVDVACLGGPISDLLDMIGHDPSILKTTARLHPPNQVNTTTLPDFDILKMNTLLDSSPYLENMFC